jgi:hypothetical protein
MVTVIIEPEDISRMMVSLQRLDTR